MLYFFFKSLLERLSSTCLFAVSLDLEINVGFILVESRLNILLTFNRKSYFETLSFPTIFIIPVAFFDISFFKISSKFVI